MAHALSLQIKSPNHVNQAVPLTTLVLPLPFPVPGSGLCPNPLAYTTAFSKAFSASAILADQLAGPTSSTDI